MKGWRGGGWVVVVVVGGLDWIGLDWIGRNGWDIQ